MCTRYDLHADPKQLVTAFGTAFEPFPLRYNVAPTQYVPLVRPCADKPGCEVATCRWGLVPSWAADLSIGNRLINARGETVAEKPTFRSAFKRRRCLVPAPGFYQWTDPPKQRQPYNFHMQDGRPFAFAGMWECWQKDGESVESFTIITTEANELLAKYHDRMPVIVHPNDFDLWLRGEPDDAAVVLQPYPADAMTAVAVSTRLNNPRNEGPELLAAV
jgi:putative SOS response-associated peptidase YedK